MSTEPKTTKTKKSVSAFLSSISDARRRKEAKEINALMKRVTGKKPALWGSSIVGFGTYHYVYESGREGDWPMVGFSPRKANLTIYIMPGYTFPKYKKLLKKLGPHKLGKSCLYITDLSKIHLPTLEALVKESVKDMKKRYPTR